MTNLSLEVNCYGGADVREAIKQMVALADRIGITIWATINDVRTLARPGDDAAKIFSAWDAALGSDLLYKYASDDTNRQPLTDADP